jgi:hypothetical protein
MKRSGGKRKTRLQQKRSWGRRFILTLHVFNCFVSVRIVFSFRIVRALLDAYGVVSLDFAGWSHDMDVVWSCGLHLLYLAALIQYKFA